MNFSALAVALIRIECIPPRSQTHVSWGHTGSSSRANKRRVRSGGRGHVTPQQPDCIMRKFFKSKKKREGERSNLKHMGITGVTDCWQQRHLTQPNLINSLEFYGVMHQ